MQNRQTIPSRRLWRRQLQYVAPHWEVLVLALGSLIVMSATVPVLVALIQPTLDGVVGDKNFELMPLILLAIVGLFAVRSLAGHVGTFAINWIGSRMALDLRVEMFHKLLMLPAFFYPRSPDAPVFSVITSGAARLAEAFTTVITVMVKDTFTIIGLLAWMFYLDWLLTLVAASMSSVVLLITRLTGKRLQRITREVGQTMDGLSHVLEESIQNYREVRLYGAEGYEIERMRKQADRIYRATARRRAVVSLGVPFAQMSIAIGLGLIIYIAAQHALEDKITGGGVASIAAGMVMLIEPIRRIAEVNESMGYTLNVADAVFSLLDHDIESDEGTSVLQQVRGELKFVHVSYCPKAKRDSAAAEAACEPRPNSSGETYAPLRDITFTVKPGELVALVDSSGAKSTLLNLVPRFLDPTSGQILLDGHDLRSLTLASLRANIALVSGETREFNDTIAANIAFGAMNRATEGNITAAAHAAHASEFIRRMPQGLQTMIGEQEQKLSGNQRLRIAIARALLKDPPILLLDETFDAIDAESAHHAEAALEIVTRGRTTLVIEPRLSTLQKADSVVLLQEGRIIDSGRHGELMARNRAYAKFSHSLLKPEKVVTLHNRRNYPEAD